MPIAEMRYAEGKLNSIGHQGFQEEVIVHERGRGTIESKLSTVVLLCCHTISLQELDQDIYSFSLQLLIY